MLCVYSIQILVGKKQSEGPREESSGDRGAALIDKIQHESTSHHFIFQERNLSILCIVKHTGVRSKNCGLSTEYCSEQKRCV